MSNKIISYCVIACCFIVVLSTCASITIKLVEKDLRLYRMESACVAKLIAVEVERRDIETGKGTCWRKDKS